MSARGHTAAPGSINAAERLPNTAGAATATGTGAATGTSPGDTLKTA
eukprot:CAMPEP_0198560730 /NCGR_PEP_ID=MMETSP1462-20131121/94378_1 /TAXON_ID=1333877 /ORGANISM="Brandtodinium nutriculum, Strain RCC3387" /LENGTH=46 /DNA_ID= /DNA_START= /DNA_END= /DNA_ORIENTATION=